VTEVRPGTPAARAELQGATDARAVNGQSYPTGGDVITEVDGEQVTSADELRSQIDSHSPGDQVTLTVVRNGDERTVTVTLAQRPS
jgi:serine protease Do